MRGGIADPVADVEDLQSVPGRSLRTWRRSDMLCLQVKRLQEILKAISRRQQAPTSLRGRLGCLAGDVFDDREHGLRGARWFEKWPTD